MNKSALFIGLLLLAVNIQAQNIRGVWFAGCNLKIDKYAGVDEYQIDSLYGVEGSILDFVSDEEFLIKAIGGEKRVGKYTQSGDILNLRVDEFQWKAILLEESIKLTLIDSVDYGLELFYKKVKPSNIPKGKLLDSLNVVNTNWKTSFEWGASFFSFTEKDSIDILEKPRVFISNFSDIRTGSEVGNYQIDTYKNHIFLYLLNRETFSEKVIHFSEYSKGTYKGVLFDCFQPLMKPIPVENIQMEQEPIILEYELINEMADLSGRYQLQLLDLDRLGVSESVNTVISYLELSDDFSCKIDAYITENMEGIAVLRKLEKKGSWELDPSGHFILVKFQDEFESLLTIEKINDTRYLYLNRNPWPEEEELNTVLKFKKQ